MDLLVGKRAICPYCTKTFALDVRAALPAHSVPGGVCDGAGRRVAMFDSMGRAVFASLPSDVPVE